MSSEYLQENAFNTFQRPIPEINLLKFPKSDLHDFTILQGVENK